MKKTLYRLVAWVLLSGLATLGYSQATENADSTLAQADDTQWLIITSGLGLYALVLSYLYFFDAQPKLRKRTGNIRHLKNTVQQTAPSNLDNRNLNQQVTKLTRREVSELEDFIERQEIEMETIRLELKKQASSNRPTDDATEQNPTSNLSEKYLIHQVAELRREARERDKQHQIDMEALRLQLKQQSTAPTRSPKSIKSTPASPPSVTRFYLATPNSDGSFVNNPMPQFDSLRSLYEFELNPAGTEAKFSFASDANTIANALSHPDRYLMPACLYPVPPATARNIRTMAPGKARLSPDGQRWLIEQKAHISFEFGPKTL